MFPDVELVPGKEMHSAVGGAAPGTSLTITVYEADAAKIKVDGSEMKPPVAAEDEEQHLFSDAKDPNSGQSVWPKTGAVLYGKTVVLWIVLLLDVAFVAWLALKNKQKRWPRLIKPTQSLQLQKLE